jgi:ABC-type glycerol-3-phosphate transport system permease component
VTTGIRARRRRDAIGRAILLTAAVVGFLLPLAWTALAAFGLLPNNNTRPPTWGGSPTLDNFLQVGVAEHYFWQELATSTVSAACAAALTTGAAFLAAYGLARSRLRAERPIAQAFLVLASLPAMAYVLPLSDLMRRIGLSDTLVGLVLTEAAVTAPLAVYVLNGAMRQLSSEWEDAAWLDGAGVVRILGQIVLPLVAPTVAATAIILFVLDWNLLLVPLVLTGIHVRTIPVGMIDFFTFERELEWPVAAAALMVSLVPVAVLVAVFHRVLARFALDGGRAIRS